MPFPPLATITRRPAEALLLDVAEALHASALTARNVSQLVGEPSSRVRTALASLQAEGLVAPAGGGPGRLARYTLTSAGAEALATRGRFPGDVAVLFTDLVASTQLIAEHGEIGAHERRIRHLALLRAAVLRAGGYEVKGLGDGLMVAFRDAATAARCAADMQAAVAADADGLGLRVGIHLGSVLRDGEDLHGSTVILASRLCDQANAGETLASQEVVAAAGEAVRATPIGQRQLKGLAAPTTTYRLDPPTYAAHRSRRQPLGHRADRRSANRDRRTSPRATATA